MYKWSDCKFCFGIGDRKCIICGAKKPKKKDLSEKELRDYENWFDFVHYHFDLRDKMRKYNQWSTGCATQDQKLYDLLGYWRWSIPKPSSKFMKFIYRDKEVQIRLTRYTDNNLCVQVMDCETKELIGTLSINVPDCRLYEGEFCVKNYSENQELAQAAKASSLFLDTGRTFSTGFVTVPIWRF